MGLLEQMLPLIIAEGASAAGSLLSGKVQAGASDRAAELQSQSAKDQLNALLTMYGIQRNDLAPYRTVGTNALSVLQSWNPNGKNPIPQADFSQYRPNQVSLPPALQRLLSGSNALSVGNGMGDGTPTFNDLPTSGIHGTPAGVGGGAGKGCRHRGSNWDGVSAWSCTALGAGVGAVAGAVGGLFDNNNSDKNFASQGIGRVRDWTWNTLVPKLNSGEIGPDEAEAAFNNVWKRWEDSMRTTPQFNSGVADKSIASQRAYFQPFYDAVAKARTNPVAAGNPWQQNALRA